MARIRAVVVEDSLTIRRYLVGRLTADPGIEVVGEAEDGKQAIELVERLRPDVVTLDMMLPVLSGLSATEYIMAYCPTPILIVSASHNRGEVFKTYDALSAGAVDVMDKPRGDQFDPAWEKRFIATVKLISKIKVITHPRAKFARAARGPGGWAGSSGAGGQRPYECLAIGASTGGPAAVLELLGGLGAGFPLPILLVIHIGEPFGMALCEWLDGLSPLRVAWAGQGQPWPGAGGGGGVFMAPHDRHLIVRDGAMWLSEELERHSCRPSVDVLFESVAREFGSGGIACLLTGMGRDGAAGMRAVQQAGGVTLAQDEASCVVFGMPREAIALGAAGRVLPLEEMAPALRALAETGQPVRR